MNLDRKTLYQLLAGAILLIAMIIFFVLTRPLPELEMDPVIEIRVAEEQSKAGVFGITNLQTNQSVYKLDDGQDIEGNKPKRTIDFTWDSTGNPFKLVNPYLVFSVTDENENEVIEYLYGNYNNVPLDYGEGSAVVPVLCSTQPVETCMFGDEFDPAVQYRVRSTLRDCSAHNDNPTICSRGEQEVISVTHSNWFQFEE